MMHAIRFGAIFTGPRSSFATGSIVEAHVVHLVAPVQAPQHFERTDLASTCCGMQEIGLCPENSHPSAAGEGMPRPHTKLNDCRAGNAAAAPISGFATLFA